MKKYIIILLLPLMFTACSHKSIPVSPLVVNINLDNKDYEIVGKVTGEASVSWFYVFIAIYSPNNMFEDGSLNGELYSSTKSLAIRDAMNRHDFDTILSPKFETTRRGLWPIFWVTKVKVEGIGIKYKYPK